MKKLIVLASSLFIGFIACTDQSEKIEEQAHTAPVLPTQHYDYRNLQLPEGSSNANIIDCDFCGSPGTNFGSIQITDEGATLGRVLFYDKQLSLNNTISCGSCHHQDKAFADGERFFKRI